VGHILVEDIGLVGIEEDTVEEDIGRIGVDIEEDIVVGIVEVGIEEDTVEERQVEW